MISDIMDKIGAGVPLTSDEQAELHNWSLARNSDPSLSNVFQLDQISPFAGVLKQGEYQTLDNQNRLRLIMSAQNLLARYGVSGYFIGFDANGNPQFWADADNGTLTGAGGLLTIDADGLTLNSTGIFANFWPTSNAGPADRFYYGGFQIGTYTYFGYHSFSSMGSEKITNGTFDANNLTGWTLTGSPVVVAGGPKSAYAVQVDANNYISETITVTDATYYLLSLYTKNGTGTPQITTTGVATNFEPAPGGASNWAKHLCLIKTNGTSLVLNFKGASGTAFYDTISLFELGVFTYSGTKPDGTGSYFLNPSLYCGITSAQIQLNTNELDIKELSSAYTPPTGFGTMYFKTDHKPYAKGSDGTEYPLTGHWLPFGVYSSISPITVGGSIPFSATVDRSLNLISWFQSVYVDGTNNGSNYWTVKLFEGGGSQIASVSTSGISGSTLSELSTTSFSTNPVSASNKILYVTCTKTGSPGGLYVYGPALWVVA